MDLRARADDLSAQMLVFPRRCWMVCGIAVRRQFFHAETVFRGLLFDSVERRRVSISGVYKFTR